MKNRTKGIPNLMLYLCIGNAIVYFMSQFAGNHNLYYLLVFSRPLILQGQVWRLFTYPLTYLVQSPILMIVSLFCYYSLGSVIERIWGTLKFNLFYLSGILMMDVYCMIFGGQASVVYLNLSLFLSYATLFPDAGFLLFFIIPVKAWIFGLFDLALVIFDLFTNPFPYNLFSVISIANYLLFFGKDTLNLIPMSWQLWLRKHLGLKAPARQQAKVIHFRTAPKSQPEYRHRCTVCGRTDVTNPELEFRYCSRCSGYHCYCQDHINNHAHIE